MYVCVCVCVFHVCLCDDVTYSTLYIYICVCVCVYIYTAAVLPAAQCYSYIVTQTHERPCHVQYHVYTCIYVCVYTYIHICSASSSTLAVEFDPLLKYTSLLQNIVSFIGLFWQSSLICETAPCVTSPLYGVSTVSRID